MAIRHSSNIADYQFRGRGRRGRTPDAAGPRLFGHHPPVTLTPPRKGTDVALGANRTRSVGSDANWGADKSRSSAYFLPPKGLFDVWSGESAAPRRLNATVPLGRHPVNHRRGQVVDLAEAPQCRRHQAGRSFPSPSDALGGQSPRGRGYASTVKRQLTTSQAEFIIPTAGPWRPHPGRSRATPMVATATTDERRLHDRHRARIRSGRRPLSPTRYAEAAVNS
jgi:hypothetical protein